MEIQQTGLEGVLLLKPKVFGDERGYFFEAYNRKQFEEAAEKVEFRQDNESKSSYGVLRGLHYQLPPFTQAKLVRVIYGEVLDIVVDIRKSSPTFGQHTSAVLSGANKYQIYVPHGFAHGFAVLSSEAIFTYKVDNYYAPDYEAGIMHNDPELGIDWQLPLEDRILSEKDKQLPDFKHATIFENL